MRMLSWAIIWFMFFSGIVVTLIKKYVMLNLPQITMQNFKDISVWINLLSNPLALLTLAMGFGFWGLNMWLFSLESASRVTTIMYGLGIMSMIGTVGMCHFLFGETFTPIQMQGFITLLLAGGISTIGVYWLSMGVA